MINVTKQQIQARLVHHGRIARPWRADRRAALADGNAVVAAGRNAAAITERLGDSHALLPVALDVTDEAQAKAAVEAALEKFGRIDVLVNNAGFGLLAAVEESSDADVRRMYDTNVFGLLNVTRAVLPVMRAQRSGHVINMSSIGGYRAGAGFGVYSSTKFAVEGITESLHAELKPLGIHATVVEPGYFRTDFLDASSLVVGKEIIADYDETSGNVRRFAAGMNHNQPGDPGEAGDSPGRRWPMQKRRLCVFRSARTR